MRIFAAKKLAADRIVLKGGLIIMRKIFRKALTVLGSAALIGATVGTAAAANYPSPFTSNTAIIVGASAAPSDNVAAASIASNLDAMSSGSTTTLTGGEGVTEDEVPLGGQIDFATSKVESTLTDSKIPALVDDRISWDDGTGSDDYNVQEQIAIGDMAIKTTLNDEDLEGVAMSNNKGLEYKYIFDDAFPISHVGMDNSTGTADDLYLTILGKQYEVQSMTASSITVVTSEQQNVQVGSSVTVDGKTFTLTDVYETSVIVNGEVISDGASKKINGMKVQVDDILYSSDNLDSNKAILRIGENIQKTYSNGDEFVGQDEDDPLWTWDITNLGSAGGYIGVKYSASIEDSGDNDAGDSIKYVGEGYVMPNNFAEVSLDSISDLSYEDVVVSFDGSIDLYNVTSNSDEVVNNGKAIVLTGENDDTFTFGGHETREVYLYYADNSTSNLGAAVGTNGAVVAFYRDIDGDSSPTNYPRFSNLVNLTGSAALTRTKIGQIDIGDTAVDVDVTVASGILTLTFEDPIDSDISLTVGGTALADEAGTLEGLGSSLEDAQTTDVIVNGTNVGTKESSIMDYYGTIVADGSDVKAQADSDEVTLSIPSDRVYAQVSVMAGGDASTTESGVMTYKDSEASMASGMNLIVVGGSAINSVAADLLGGAYREAAFTEATGVAAGQAMIKSFDRSGKTALLVAGYNAADTEKAVTYLLNNDVDTTVGSELKVTSATEATVVTA